MKIGQTPPIMRPNEMDPKAALKIAVGNVLSLAQGSPPYVTEDMLKTAISQMNSLASQVGGSKLASDVQSFGNSALSFYQSQSGDPWDKNALSQAATAITKEIGN